MKQRGSGKVGDLSFLWKQLELSAPQSKSMRGQSSEGRSVKEERMDRCYSFLFLRSKNKLEIFNGVGFRVLSQN